MRQGESWMRAAMHQHTWELHLRLPHRLRVTLRWKKLRRYFSPSTWYPNGGLAQFFADACGGVFEVPNGTITSPSFPDLYPLGKNCVWEIVTQPMYKITLNFTHFDLEGLVIGWCPPWELLIKVFAESSRKSATMTRWTSSAS